MEVLCTNFVWLLRKSRKNVSSQYSKIFRGKIKDQLWQDMSVLRFRTTWPGDHSRLCLYPMPDHLGSLFKCAILQQASKQQVSFFQQCELVLSISGTGGQQPGCFEFQQRCSNDHEGRGVFKHFFGGFQRSYICNELIGYFSKCYLGDVHASASNE